MEEMEARVRLLRERREALRKGVSVPPMSASTQMLVDGVDGGVGRQRTGNDEQMSGEKEVNGAGAVKMAVDSVMEDQTDKDNNTRSQNAEEAENDDDDDEDIDDWYS